MNHLFRVREQNIPTWSEKTYLKNTETQHRSVDMRFQVFNEFIETLLYFLRHLKLPIFILEKPQLILFPVQFNLPRETANNFISLKTPFKSNKKGNSLEVQWLGLCASTAGGTGSIPGWGTKILHTAQSAKKKKKVMKKPRMSVGIICRNLKL